MKNQKRRTRSTFHKEALWSDQAFRARALGWGVATTWLNSRRHVAGVSPGTCPWSGLTRKAYLEILGLYHLHVHVPSSRMSQTSLELLEPFWPCSVAPRHSSSHITAPLIQRNTTQIQVLKKKKNLKRVLKRMTRPEIRTGAVILVSMYPPEP